jgi:hypothetical protein
MATMVSRTALTTLFCFFFATTSWALPQRVISSSFFEPFLFPQSGPMLDTAIAGVPNFFHGGPADVRVRNWNQLQGNSGTKLNLFDAQGAFTDIDAQWSATNVASNNYLNPIINGDSMMMNGHLSSSTLGATGLVTVTATNLDSAIDTLAGYEVWVYADSEGLARTESLLVDDGIHVAMALTMTDTVSDLGGTRQFDFTADYDEGTTDGLGVWARFGGLTGNSFTIQALSLNPGESAYINGFQIIGPELVPLDGDYNFNRVVDAADYVVWRKGLGTIYKESHYTVWRAHFGQTAGSGLGASANAAVPERASVVVLLAGLALRNVLPRPHVRLNR